MSWDAVVAICEMLGLIAIVMTLVYVARQIRENTAAVASNTQQTHFAAWNALSDLIIESSDVADLVRKGDRSNTSLSDSEAVRFEWLATKLFGLYESVFADRTSGLIEAEIADAYERYYLSYCCKPGFRSFWESHRSWYFHDFVAYLDQKMSEASSEE